MAKANLFPGFIIPVKQGSKEAENKKKEILPRPSGRGLKNPTDLPADL